ncbi:MAG TPA: hypothetical protein VIN59_00175 [Alphaproteobacteria bacterium]
MAKALESVGKAISNSSFAPDAAQLSVLRQDLNTLAKDAKDLKDDAVQIGTEQARKASAAAREQLQHAKEGAVSKFEKSEAYVRNNPGQSVAMAFLAGALLSLFLGGGRR